MEKKSKKYNFRTAGIGFIVLMIAGIVGNFVAFLFNANTKHSELFIIILCSQLFTLIVVYLVTIMFRMEDRFTQIEQKLNKPDENQK